MNSRIKRLSATSTYPEFTVTVDGIVLLSNDADEPLLHEWGVSVGEKLPLSIREIVQRVISQNSPEKIEVRVGKKVYLVIFHPSSEEECVNVYGFDISDKKKPEEKPQESEARNITNLDISEIIDINAIKSLMDDFYKFVHIPIGLNDLKGDVLVSVGWQDICIKFHRINPETCKHCVESDTKLSAGVLPRQFMLYKCKNDMWDVVTPIIVGSQHVGYIFLGQFFFDDEPLDYELFRSKARQYGFNETEYIAALEKVPRLSREILDTIMTFFMKFANMLSQLGYSNLKLARSLAERDALVNALQESQKSERARSEELAAVLDAAPAAVMIAHDPWAIKVTGNRLSYEWNRLPEGTNMSKVFPEEKRPETHKLFKDGVEIPVAEMPLRIAAFGKEVHDYELDVVYPEGTMRHVLCNARPLRDEQGNPRGAVSALIDITERKKAEEALRLSSLYNRSLIEASLDPLVTIGPDGKITDVNGSTEEITGYSKKELIGTDFSNYFTEPEKASKGYQQVLTDGKIRDYLLEIQHKNGHVTPVLYNACIYRDENCQVIGVFASARDIAERKKTEEKLQESEEKYRSIVETANEGIYVVNGEAKITYANKMIAEMSGYTLEEIVGRPIWNFISEESKPVAKRNLEKRLRGVNVSYELKLIRKDGSFIWAFVSAKPFFNKDGKFTGYLGMLTDINERKITEEKLRESEEKYRNIVDLANEGILVIDDELRVIFYNKKLMEMLGYDSEEAVGRLIWDFIREESKVSVKLNMENRRQGINESYELELICKDGSSLWVILNAKSLFDKDGTFMGSISMLTDISKRKAAEEALANIEIARKKEIHHRIKNNLQVISSLLDLQADKFNNREFIKYSEVMEAFRESQDRVISMALIHEELYKGGGLEKLNFSPYIEELAENLFKTYSFGNKVVSLKLNLDTNVFFNMDVAVPVGMIVNELVTNSFKHAFQGRNEGEIKIKLHREENGAYINTINEIKSTTFTLTISDNGIGMPVILDIEELNSLGLQLVTSLVAQLEGELEIKRNNGTEFIIRFTVTEKNHHVFLSASQQITNKTYM